MGLPQPSAKKRRASSLWPAGHGGDTGSPRRGRLARRHWNPRTLESCASLLGSVSRERSPTDRCDSLSTPRRVRPGIAPTARSFRDRKMGHGNTANCREMSGVRGASSLAQAEFLESSASRGVSQRKVASFDRPFVTSAGARGFSGRPLGYAEAASAKVPRCARLFVGGGALAAPQLRNT